jgi:sterol desaturase/sphingolipid hydroxylase (fatty acid hydroxylase superfamily)
MSMGVTQSSRALGELAGSLLLAALFASFYALHFVGGDSLVDAWLPNWTTLAIIAAMFVLERVLARRAFVSQRSLVTRDVVVTLINVYFTAIVTGMILLPVLLLLSESLFGRATVFASPEQLGPIWLQVLVVLLAVSFCRYWIHRWEHSNAFLWKLHSYHHRMNDLQAINAFVSHPIDYALRNVVVFTLLGLVGFDPLALVIVLPAALIPAVFSHFGGELHTGFLNGWLVTPEVHRWHHSAAVPEGHEYSVNYGVEFSFWDRLFGTYYLPRTTDSAEEPERIGHPAGLADESNSLRLVLEPVGLYRPWPWIGRAGRRKQPAS